MVVERCPWSGHVFSGVVPMVERTGHLFSGVAPMVERTGHLCSGVVCKGVECASNTKFFYVNLESWWSVAALFSNSSCCCLNCKCSKGHYFQSLLL